MKIWSLLGVGFIVASMSGCSAMGGAATKVQGLDDDLEEQVKVTTYSYDKPFLIMGGSQDWFLRGYVDKSTKKPTYQLYAIVNSGQWMYWDEARYKVGGKLTNRELSRVGSDVDCSKFGCAHYEDVVLSLDRSTLNSWKNEGGRVRFASSKVSGHRDINVNPDEVGDFLKKMDFALGAITGN